MTPTYTILEGDCLHLLRGLPSNSVHAIVTDPPYGLTQGKKGGSGPASVNVNSPQGRSRVTTGFMGMTWDASVPPVEVWEECLRVLRPGGHLLAFAGTRTQHRMAVNIEDAGFEIRDMLAWIYGSGMPHSHNLKGDFEGWGTGLKPSLEPITMARKPLTGTVAQGMAAHGTGALHIDACRVQGAAGSGTWGSSNAGCQDGRTFNGSPTGAEFRSERHSGGRWPANLIHDGSADVLGLFPAEAGASAPVTGTEPSSNTKNVYGQYGRAAHSFHGDSGSAARFFYCAKASPRDRNEGVPDGNGHPTVKPSKLMRHLVRLVTPVGGTVLDPFMGSGSTGKAALLEGMHFIGMELTPAYVPIARARLKHAHAQVRDKQPQLLAGD